MKSTFVILLAAGMSCHGSARQEETAAPTVRSFYQWYVPWALADHAEPAWSKVLRVRPSALSDRLRRALAAGLARQARTRDIVGIDFDPFLDSQDPCGRAIVGSVPPGRRAVVPVRIVCGSGAVTRLRIVAVRQGARFVIDDIRYADGNTLRRMLPPH